MDVAFTHSYYSYYSYDHNYNLYSISLHKSLHVHINCIEGVTTLSHAMTQVNLVIKLEIVKTAQTRNIAVMRDSLDAKLMLIVIRMSVWRTNSCVMELTNVQINQMKAPVLMHVLLILKSNFSCWLCIYMYMYNYTYYWFH